MKKLSSLTALTLFASLSFAQTETVTEEPKGEFQINGSVDAYYRYNFANSKLRDADGNYVGTNNFTSFTNSQNSFELGMASLTASYTKGKASVVVDLGFGSRATEFAYAETGALQAIKQAYVSYNPTDNIRISAGKWGTHLGYEVLDPQLNRNYSMSYMFSYGPFSHTGIKADFTLGDGFGLMAGIANPADYISASFAKKNVIAQFSKTGEKFNAYLNYVGGKDTSSYSSHQVGLTATAAISDIFSLGYDGTVKFAKADGADAESWWGSALYLNIDPTEKFGITLRGEYFDDKKNVTGTFGTSLTQATLSFNFKPVSGLAIIPEFRLDSAKDPFFVKDDKGTATKSTGSFIVAAVYSF